jgi:hypothetical protein
MRMRVFLIAAVFFCALIANMSSLLAADPKDKSQRIHTENSSDPELEKIDSFCGPTYETACLLNMALDNLESYDLTQQPTFGSLLYLSSLAIESKNTEFMRRVLKDLETLHVDDTVPNIKDEVSFIRVRHYSPDLERRMAVVRINFALGDFDKGLKTLEEFQGETQAFSYGAAPPIAAISYLMKNKDLVHANKVALLTKDMSLKIDKPSSGCVPDFFKNNADIIADLITANMEAGNFHDVIILLPLTVDQNSIYYAGQNSSFTNGNSIYGNIFYKIGEFYERTPSAQKPSQEVCASYLSDYEKNYRQKQEKPDGQILLALGKIGCQNEKISFANEMQNFVSPPKEIVITQELPGISSREEDYNQRYYDDLSIILGKGNYLLDQASSQKDTYLRFRRYLFLAEKFHFNDFPALETEAIDRAKELYKNAEKESSKTDKPWIESLVNSLWKMERKDDVKNMLDQLVKEALDTNNKKLAEHLVGFLAMTNHPACQEMAKNDYADRCGSKKGKVDEIIALVKQEKINEAEEKLEELDRSDRSNAKPKIFPALMTAKSKGSLFKEIWSSKMKSCFRDSRIGLKTDEPSILIPHCISKTVSQGLNP